MTNICLYHVNSILDVLQAHVIPKFRHKTIYACAHYFRDEDMQSMASLMSVNNNSDIAPLEDFEDEDFSLSENSMKNSIQEVTQHLQKMTNSLSGSDFASTPMSSINFSHSYS